MDRAAEGIDSPPVVQALCREYDVAALDWDADRDLIDRRILTEGSWDAVQRLRGRMGDPALRQ